MPENAMHIVVMQGAGSNLNTGNARLCSCTRSQVSQPPLALTKASEVGNLTNACQAKPQCSIVGKQVLWASQYFGQASVVDKTA